MTNQEIIDYVINTPNNTNPTILKQMLKDIAGSGNLELDTTLSIAGKAADAKAVGDALKNLGGDSSGGSGLTATEKNLILTLFKAVQYDENVKATYAQLEVLWTGGSAITYSVQNLLTNASTSNIAETATGGMQYTAILTPDEGYVLDTVTVTMDGVDVTADVYTDGKISILSVSGDLVITATTVNLAIVAPVYSLTEAAVFDGTNNIDTGYRLFDADKDFTVCLDFKKGAKNQGSVICEYVSGNNGSYFGVHLHSSYFWAVHFCTMGGNYHNVDNGGAKYVITHTAGTGSITTYYVVDGTKATGDLKPSFNISSIFGNTETLKIGGDAGYPKNDQYFIGTINALDIYERILDDAEISEFLGV